MTLGKLSASPGSSSWMPPIFSGLVGLSKLAVLSNGGLIWSKKILFRYFSVEPPLEPYEGSLEQGFGGIPGTEGSLEIPDTPGL